MGVDDIRVKRLDSGYYHVRGIGPCNYSQPPNWPCSIDELKDHAHPEASEDFIASAVAKSILLEVLR